MVYASIFHTCFALVANTHLWSSWCRSFSCNSWALRPGYARGLYTYMFRTLHSYSSSFCFGVKCLHFLQCPPVLAIFTLNKLPWGCSSFFVTLIKACQLQCLQSFSNNSYWHRWLQLPLCFQLLCHQAVSVQLFRVFHVVLCQQVSCRELRWFQWYFCCIKSESAFQKELFGLICNNWASVSLAFCMVLSHFLLTSVPSFSKASKTS